MSRSFGQRSLCLAFLICMVPNAQQAFAQFGAKDDNGYIDSAVIGNRLRFRYDVMEDVEFIDRARYLFPAAQQIGDRATDPENGGPPERYQELKTYIEYAFHPRFSIFGEFPARYVTEAFAIDPLNPSAGEVANQIGLGDLSAGLRYSLISRENALLTAQFRAIAPTGGPSRCLGTGHASLEAGLLCQWQASERLTFFGELVDWQAVDDATVLRDDGILPPSPLEGTPFRANVLRYGIGASYDICRGTDDFRVPRIAAVCEVVGWTVTDGLKSKIIYDFPRPGDDVRPTGILIKPLDASGDTIVNLKLGTRVDFARRSSVYVGYGFALTDEVWYRHMLRVEYRLSF